MGKGVRTVDLGHHEGHIRILAEGGAVVDEDGAALYDVRRELDRHGILDGTEHEVHAFEAVFFRLFHSDVLSCERDGLSCASGAGQQLQLVHGDLIFFQNVDHFTADGSRRAEHCDLITHDSASLPCKLTI